MKFEEAIKIAGKEYIQDFFETRAQRSKITYRISNKNVVDVSM